MCALLDQFLPPDLVKLLLEIGDHQLWPLEEQLQCGPLETEQDGELLQQAQPALPLRVLLILQPEG